jgi:hypothetical protein
LAGALPAIVMCLLTFAATRGVGATFDVSTPVEFQAALDASAINGQNDVIRVAAGTFSLTAPLVHSSAENYSLTLQGAGRSSTILDGGRQSQILTIATSRHRAVVLIEDMTFRNGVTNGSGGALLISTEEAGIRLERCEVSDCAATGGDSVGGGAMLNSVAGTVTVVACEFIRNDSSGNVGGLAIGTESGSVTIANCTFASNHVDNTGGSEHFGDGGGSMVYSDGTSHALICSNTFVGNSASGGSNPDGGGLMTYQMGADSTLLLKDNVFTGNTAGLGGGGCILRFNLSSVAEVRGNVFTGNRTLIGSGGGALAYINQGTLTYVENRHIGNYCAEHGGGAWVNHLEGSALIQSNTFAFNQATNNGGGLSLTTDGGALVAARNVFDANRAGDIGGGLNMAAGTGTVDAYNNTVYNNVALNDGGGLYVYLDQAAAQSVLNNNIVWQSVPNALGYSFGGGGRSLAMTYSAVELGDGEPWFGTGCITNAPAFRNPEAGDFRLTWSGYPVNDPTKSPCIDSGNTGSPLDADGTRADMGARSFPQGVAAAGTPHWWLDAYDLTAEGLSFDEAESTDTDADTFKAWQEYIADTDPTNAAALCRIVEVSGISPFTVTFDASSNRFYTLMGCSDLVERVWTTVPGAGPRRGAGGADSMSDTNEVPRGPFYRLQVKMLP